MSSIALAKEDDFWHAVLSYGWQAIRTKVMFYAYILQSIRHASQFYHGSTTDLKTRIADHNAGKSPHATKYAPWKPVFYAAFESAELAQSFERYLKSGSGHAFAKKHFGIGK